MTDPEVQTLEVKAIQIDPDINPRAWLAPSAVETYSALYREHEGKDTPLPPLDVFYLDEAYYVTDGHHRLEAAQQASLTTLQCRVFRGTRQEAFMHAVSANAGRGVPFGPMDYERIITRMLSYPDTSKLSNRQIARRIGCSHTRVNQLRPRVERRATVEQALSRVETVSTRAKNPKTIAQQQVAGFLDLPLETVKTYEKQCGSLKDTLMEQVVWGMPLEQARAALRQEVERGPRRRRGGPRRAQADATARARERREVPQAPLPSATASDGAGQVAAVALQQAGLPHETSGAAPEPASVAGALGTDVRVEPCLLDAGTAPESQSSSLMPLPPQTEPRAHSAATTVGTGATPTASSLSTAAPSELVPDPSCDPSALVALLQTLHKLPDPAVLVTEIPAMYTTRIDLYLTRAVTWLNAFSKAWKSHTLIQASTEAAHDAE
jgi:hypothetical protein